jgi:uncharacterized membrane protein
MVSRIKNNSSTKTDNNLRWVGIFLALLGAADAIYLLVLKLTQLESMCVGNHGCITVNNSIYSEIYKIPVSLLGLFAYVFILLVFLLEPRWNLIREHSSLILFGTTLIGVLFSAYLTFIEFFVIDAVCPFCITSAVLITLLFILAIIRLVKKIS